MLFRSVFQLTLFSLFLKKSGSFSVIWFHLSSSILPRSSSSSSERGNSKKRNPNPQRHATPHHTTPRQSQSKLTPLPLLPSAGEGSVFPGRLIGRVARPPSSNGRIGGFAIAPLKSSLRACGGACACGGWVPLRVDCARRELAVGCGGGSGRISDAEVISGRRFGPPGRRFLC